MKSYRENPDGEENRIAERDNNRYIGGLKLQSRLQKSYEQQDADENETAAGKSSDSERLEATETNGGNTEGRQAT